MKKFPPHNATSYWIVLFCTTLNKKMHSFSRFFFITYDLFSSKPDHIPIRRAKFYCKGHFT